MNWIYEGKPLTERPEGIYGFIYEITYTNGKKYIGKKAMIEIRRLKPRVGDRVNAKRLKEYEANWQQYNGSSKLTSNLDIAEKKILMLCPTKIDLTYFETYYLMMHNVLFNEEYLNQNIMGKFFTGKITGSKEHIKEDK